MASFRSGLAVRQGLLYVGVFTFIACGSTLEPREVEWSESVEVERQALSYTDIRSTIGSSVARGYTCGAANEVTPSCATGSAADLTYLWTAPTTNFYRFTTSGTNFNTVLRVALYSSVNMNPPEYTCSTSSINLRLVAGQKVLVTVTGINSASCGVFTLGVSTGGCASGESCRDSIAPLGQCYKSQGVCSNGTCVYPPKALGETCEDGDACTVVDYCNGSGSCIGQLCECPGEEWVCSDGGCFDTVPPFEPSTFCM